MTSTPSQFIALLSVAASAVSIGDGEYAKIDFEDLMFEKKPYNETHAYQQSKLANDLHAMEASKKYSSEKLISVAVHPDWVLSNLDVHAFCKMMGDGFLGNTVASLVRKFFLWKGDMLTAVDGAQTTLHCALEDAHEMKSGAFFPGWNLQELQPE